MTTGDPAEGSGEPQGGAPDNWGGGSHPGGMARPAMAWRPRTVPEQLGLAGLAAAASLVYPTVSQQTGIGLLCPLRTLTGVPCPMCGMTTAATGLGRGDLDAALAANPFVLVLAVLIMGMAVLMAARAAGLAAPAAPWPASRRRQALWAVAVLLAASWAFQLHRFGWV
jgi:Protein of unknown function (DUF2752)